MRQSGAPCIRANWTKLALKFLRQQPALGEPILARVNGDTLQQVRAAGVFDWLPAELHLSLAEGARVALGAEGARRFWRDLMRLSFERSLLKPLFDGGIRLFGRSPHGILRMTPQAYQLVTRACGRVRVEPGGGPGAVLLTFEDLPALLRTHTWVEICTGNCDATLDALQVTGSVTSDFHALAQGRFTVLTMPSKTT
jgi:hypothetical protein